MNIVEHKKAKEHSLGNVNFLSVFGYPASQGNEQMLQKSYQTTGPRF